MITHFIIERSDRDIEVEIEWTYYPCRRGTHDSFGGVPGAGPPLEPDTLEELEFNRATDTKGTEVLLDDNEIDAAREEAWDSLGELAENPENEY